MTWIALLAFLHLLCGWLVATRVAPSRRPADVCVGVLLVAFGTFYGLPVVLGWVTGRMDARIIVGAACGAVMLAAVAVAKRPRPFVGLRRLRCSLTAASIGAWIVAAAVIVLLGVELWIGFKWPVRIWDAAACHIQCAMEWALTGRFDLTYFGRKTVSQITIYPNIKAVLPWMIITMGGQLGGTSLTQWPFTVLAAFSVMALTRRCGVGTGWSWVAAFCAISAPEVIFQSLEAYCDVVFFAGAAALAWATVVTAQSRWRWPFALYLALAFALVSASKINSPLAAALWGPVVALVVWRSWPRRPGRLLRTGAIIAVIVAFSIALAGSWFIRAWRVYGNPIYPYKVSILGHQLFPGDVAGALYTDRYVELYTGGKGVKARLNTLFELWRTPSLSSWAGGLGMPFAVFGVPALLLVFLFGTWQRGPTACARRIALWFSISWFLVCPSNMNARYILPVLVAASMSIGWVIGNAPLLPRFLAGVGIIAAHCYTFYMIGPSIFYKSSPMFEKLAYHFLSGDVRTAQMDALPDGVSALDVWAQSVAAPGKCLGLPETTEFSWRAYWPGRGGSLHFVADPPPGENAAASADRLAAQGITHLYAPYKWPFWSTAMGAPARFVPVFSTVSATNGVPSRGVDAREMATLFRVVGKAGAEDRR